MGEAASREARAGHRAVTDPDPAVRGAEEVTA